MSGYEYVYMSLDSFIETVNTCNDLKKLNHIKQQLDSVIKYVETSYRNRRLPPEGHPLNLIDLGERRQTVSDRWLIVASHAA